MRDDWDARARTDAREHIATGLSSKYLFGISGLQDACTIVEDVHQYLSHDTPVLEIGCGIGRLLRVFSLVFDDVRGVDVSPEMIRQSGEFLAAFPNIKTSVNDGASLSGIGTASMGFVYSYVVFQHIPSLDVIANYVTEARRVLKPGGIFKFLVKHQSWKDAGELGTWNGVNVSREDIDKWVAATGFEFLNAYSADGHVVWVVLRVPESGPE